MPHLQNPPGDAESPPWMAAWIDEQVRNVLRHWEHAHLRIWGRVFLYGGVALIAGGYLLRQRYPGIYGYLGAWGALVVFLCVCYVFVQRHREAQLGAYFFNHAFHAGSPLRKQALECLACIADPGPGRPKNARALELLAVLEVEVRWVRKWIPLKPPPRDFKPPTIPRAPSQEPQMIPLELEPPPPPQGPATGT